MEKQKGCVNRSSNAKYSKNFKHFWQFVKVINCECNIFVTWIHHYYHFYYVLITTNYNSNYRLKKRALDIVPFSQCMVLASMIQLIIHHLICHALNPKYELEMWQRPYII